MDKLPRYGHWVSLCGEINPEKLFGFVYVVYNKAHNRFYIGKKQFFSVTKKKIVGKVRRKTCIKDSDWLRYLTSSEYVKKDIEELGKDNFEFFIIETYETKSGLVYAEANLQHKFDVMQKAVDSDVRKFYNANVAAIKFLVKEIKPVAAKRIKKLIEYKEAQHVRNSEKTVL